MVLALQRSGSNGPAVVLVHGIPGSSRVWKGVETALAVDHRVFVPDLLGFGTSPRPTAARELWADRQAEALAKTLDTAGVTEACIVGHDFGGPVALALSRQRPDLLRSCGLLAANTFADTPIPMPIRAATWPLIGRVAGSALFSEPALALMLRQGSSKRLPREIYLGDTAQRAAIGTIFSHALRNLSTLYEPMEQALRKLRVPVLVGWGTEDPFFPKAQGERTATAARRARLVVYPGAGHFLPSERPRELARDIRALAT